MITHVFIICLPIKVYMKMMPMYQKNSSNMEGKPFKNQELFHASEWDTVYTLIFHFKADRGTEINEKLAFRH